MTYEELVEKLARAIDPGIFHVYGELYHYCIRGGDTEAEARRIADGMHGWQCHEARTRAKAAIATILEALSEPSDAMLGAAQSEWPDTARMLKSALEASPLVEENK